MKKLFLNLTSQFLLITIFTFIISFSLLTYNLKQQFEEELAGTLTNHAHIIKDLTESIGLEKANYKKIDDTYKKLGKEINARLTLILPDGTVIADSDQDVSKMENHKLRFEVQMAMKGKVGSETRISPTLHIPMEYMAIPVIKNDIVAAVVRVALPIKTIKSLIRKNVYLSVFFSLLISLIISLILSYYVSKRFSKTMKIIKKISVKMSEGKFEDKILLSQDNEFFDISTSINNMSDKINNYINMVESEKNRIEAIVSSVDDGIMLINRENKVIFINTPFKQFIDVKEEIENNKSIWDVLRTPDVRGFVSNALISKEKLSSEITVNKGAKTFYYQIFSYPIYREYNILDSHAIVVHNITSSRDLENMRKEFVANASHELKTPLTSISAYTDTLIESEPSSFEERNNFYQIIKSNTNRLNNLVEDMLNLSKIEQGNITLNISQCSPTEIINELYNEYLPIAKTKRHKLHMDIAESLPNIKADKTLIKQAISNLLSNAVRYTNDGGEVNIVGKIHNNHIEFSVSDNGIGISEEEMPRIFERFYRVDKARSIKTGGTGLGLSIVKHIVELHNGKVEVKRNPEKGTTFTIKIPV